MSNKPLACVVLAAGQGSRMKSEKPKALHELAGLPMINWLLQTLEQLLPERIIVVTAPNAKDIHKAIKPHEAIIQKEPNGTADALKAALPALKEFEGNVLVVMGDAPLIKLQTLKDLIKTRAGAGMTVLGAIMQNPTGYGRIIIDENGIVHKIVEEKDATDQEKSIQLVNTGAFCIDGKNLANWLNKINNNNAQDEYYLTDLPAVAGQDRKITTVCATLDLSEVQGCNTLSELAILEKTLQDRLRTQAMEEGVTMLDPTSVYLHYDTKIAHRVLIEPHVFFGRNVTIEENVIIKGFSHIEESYIKRNAIIGPFARLRPGSKIGEEVKIGNFVEIKKSNIGNRSKINHLAYVGDTEMGEEVNFSAGAITVNYDGFEKHKTIINNNVMIGSNVNLVAPLSINEGAFIAAGSTITVNVPADALAISRSKTRTIKKWAAKYRKRKAAIIKKLKEKY
ncbi:MAG: bifunctional UDP-N-acetylglucosamine diphosphorylase/glucosamine-1-phosphate N-acetyltransferase GlmU [Alphaproteobacteria bacterium]|nr:bifunctional UDP-N-acetylglucosamine diphosphorylase/glucosamine-1-phosphate N-acetyltransferase GlmU [Alphaproteobacteria bacterium]